MRVADLIRALANMNPNAEVVTTDFVSDLEIYPEAVATREEIEFQDCTEEEMEAARGTLRDPWHVLIAGSRVLE